MSYKDLRLYRRLMCRIVLEIHLFKLSLYLKRILNRVVKDLEKEK